MAAEGEHHFLGAAGIQAFGIPVEQRTELPAPQEVLHDPEMQSAADVLNALRTRAWGEINISPFPSIGFAVRETDDFRAFTDASVVMKNGRHGDRNSNSGLPKVDTVDVDIVGGGQVISFSIRKPTETR